MAAQADSNRPRSKSMLSFGGSHRSRKSTGSVTKIDLTETPKEKNARRMTSKADPTMAIHEAQPAAQALEKATIESIRSIQHRDAYGNIITDPDRSNPTRPRLERPLDTIRSFEAAIDGSYNRRFSRMDQPDTSNAQSRRSSYFGLQSHGNGNAQRFPESGGYYGNRMSYGRPDSYVETYGNSQPHRDRDRDRDYHQSRKFGPRAQSDPMLYGGHTTQSQGIYPLHGNQQSNDTVTSSGAGSHGTEPWGNSTDPSSENSSIDRLSQVPKQDPGETYGFNGFGAGPILEEHHVNAPAYGQPGYAQSQAISNQGYAYQGNGFPPVPPPHAHANAKETRPRPPIKLGTSPGNPYINEKGGSLSQLSRGDTSEKRQSWLKRRFSKNK